MKRLIEKTVFSGFITAWRLATVPTRRSPESVKATTEGVVRPPSEFSSTVGSPPSITATQELVVPRSIPIVLLISIPPSSFLVLRQRNLSLCVGDLSGPTGEAQAGRPGRGLRACPWARRSSKGGPPAGGPPVSPLSSRPYRCGTRRTLQTPAWSDGHRPAATLARPTTPERSLRIRFPGLAVMWSTTWSKSASEPPSRVDVGSSMQQLFGL